jgi:hypothetical protein
MIRASLESRPRAGTTSPRVINRRKIATNASTCGNIWMIKRLVRPVRRPMNRKREKA